MTSDVIIVGGGPAGSVLGSYLSQRGISATIVEAKNHPRPHVGESLVLATNRVLRDIGFLETMEREGFVKKFGAAWHPAQRAGEFLVRFGEFPRDGAWQDYTYHVDRAKFDQLLLKHAESLGCTVMQGVPVRDVIFENDFACGVNLRVGNQIVPLRSKIVVDASGRETLLGRQLRIKKPDAQFNQFAVHAWFENVDRGVHADTADYIHVYFLKMKRGWVWQIPITDQITSVGVVADRNFFKESRLDPDGWFERHIKTTPDLDRAMANARRINEFKLEGDYSYALERFVGNGFLIIGDAARFVDPIFSSGVSVALHSARMASERIAAALDTGNLGEESFRPYEEKLRAGVNVWYEFISLYYKLLPVFTFFIEKKQYREDVHKLLQGEVYDRRDVEVLDMMRRFIEDVEKNPEEYPWAAEALSL